MRFFNTVYCHSCVFWSRKMEVRKQRAETAQRRVPRITHAIQHILGRFNHEHSVGYDKDERKKKCLQRTGGKSLQNDHERAYIHSSPWRYMTASDRLERSVVSEPIPPHDIPLQLHASIKYLSPQYLLMPIWLWDFILQKQANNWSILWEK